MKKIFYILITLTSLANGQVNFSDPQTLVDLTHHSSEITSIVSADLNNDGFNEIIVGSINDNTIMFYKNINGDIQKLQRKILMRNVDANSTNGLYIECKDLDGDGLIDILVANEIENKVSWFKNLGDYNFGNENVISNLISRPSAIVSGDIDNDGDNDLIVGSSNDDNVSLFKNDGNGFFGDQEILFTSGANVNEVKLFDLDNNEFLDVIAGQENGSIYWVKNNDGFSFSNRELITFSASYGFGFDFININNDEFFDIVFTSEGDDSLKFLLNIDGITFDNQTIIDNSLEDPYGLIARDFDNDGLIDIVVSTYTNDKIGWYKNNGDSTFSALSNITTNIENTKSFLLDDLDNDGNIEIVTSSYLDNVSSTQKLSIFKLVETSNQFDENIVNFFLSAANVIKVADLNNDGANDIVSGFKSIIWNINNGDGTFSSQILISENIESNFAHDLQIIDLNNDGYLDIIGLIDDKVEVYQNINGEVFNLVFTIDIEDAGQNIEVSDINGDNLQDILVSMRDGTIPLVKLISTGVFEFSTPTPVYTLNGSGYKNYDFKCADIDSDGDVDILIGEGDIFEINLLKNDGSGNFPQSSKIQSVDCDILELGDLDLDGDLDIVSVGSDPNNLSELTFLKNNSGSFSNKSVIDLQNLQSINLGDLNNDGFLDIVGTSVENSAPRDEKIVYYLYANNNFSSQNIVESLGLTENLSRNAELGDLNNDGKIDIVSTYYFSNSVKYFYNTSTLSIEENVLTSNSGKNFMFPNPYKDHINLDVNLNIYKIEIYDLFGKLIYESVDVLGENQLQLGFIKSGIYIVIANSKENTFKSKLIVE